MLPEGTRGAWAATRMPARHRTLQFGHFTCRQHCKHRHYLAWCRFGAVCSAWPVARATAVPARVSARGCHHSGHGRRSQHQQPTPLRATKAPWPTTLHRALWAGMNTVAAKPHSRLSRPGVNMLVWQWSTCCGPARKSGG